jgi:hypothetical protein
MIQRMIAPEAGTIALWVAEEEQRVHAGLPLVHLRLPDGNLLSLALASNGHEEETSRYLLKRFTPLDTRVRQGTTLALVGNAGDCAPDYKLSPEHLGVFPVAPLVTTSSRFYTQLLVPLFVAQVCYLTFLSGIEVWHVLMTGTWWSLFELVLYTRPLLVVWPLGYLLARMLLWRQEQY